MAAVVSEKMVDPTPPISQSMDSSNSPRRSPGDSPSGSPTHAAPDLSSVSTPSPPRQLDLQRRTNESSISFPSEFNLMVSTVNQQLSRVEEYRQLFRLPPDEVLIQDFNCALQENFLLQKIIPFHEITSVRRAKAVAVFPTAIEVIAAGKKYFFTSFLFRDEAFKLINEGWLHHSNGSPEVTEQQEPKSDISSQENGSSMVEESGSARQLVDESDIIESDKNDPILKEPSHFSDGGPEIVSTSTLMEIREEVNPEAIECLSPAKSSAWEPEDTDAPGVPEGYMKVAESKFPIRVEEFFNMFFSDEGVSFHESFHRKCGDKGDWLKAFCILLMQILGIPVMYHFNIQLNSILVQDLVAVRRFRNIEFTETGKFLFGIRNLELVDDEFYCPASFLNMLMPLVILLVVLITLDALHLIVDTSQEISDVPYGDYFRVEGRWDVEEDGNEQRPGCILRVYTNVAFSKKTMWKGKIVQSTVEECREAYETWIDLAHEVLKHKNLEKEEGSASNLILNEQVQPEKLENTLSQRVEHKTSDVRTSEIIPDVKDMNRVDIVTPQKNVGESSVGSLLRDAITKASSSLKHQNTSSLLLVISIAVILVLMQISILVLLSRPQRIVVVPQASCTHRMSGNGGEALALLNKQIKYLKEEMNFVETMLDKMQKEHSQLKAKLNDLELFRNQRF
ncbi:gram domain-containing protein 1a [Phtheirospermum japonicum]|uniref:Gram domain-containing protein 1a n=1 Tax=Phtheirospermum japonicum TaxID=374723 RepID=A0A830C8F3_9LAMI|nr:gram domain-containing protein 1a [Phtheirospermum japonicum]